jgi:hypothetical protein
MNSFDKHDSAALPDSTYDPSHSECGNHLPAVSRRGFISRSGLGIGGLALGLMLDELGLAAPAHAAAPAPANPLAARRSPLPARAKHVIHIFAGGGPSHVDTWDPKPALEKYRDQTLPGKSGVAFPSPFTFDPKGKSGLLVSSAFPHLGGVADELCVVRSMFTDIPAHGPATRLIHTGNAVLTRPSVGSWVLYGLGTDNVDLPGFVALGGDVEWRQSAFLPSLYQGARAQFGDNITPDKALLNLRNEFDGPAQQRLQLDLAHQLDKQYEQRAPKDEQLDARIESFELAFRMQTAATDAFDIRKEPQSVRDAYGPGALGAKLLCARRLVERGVRFVQVDAGGWDHHTGLAGSLSKAAASVDQPAAALIADLRQRGLLDSTLVIWGGEFGRTPTTAGRVDAGSGRDHHADCFSLWMAGGGVKGGTAYGSTDELGQQVAENGVHVHDLHATILRALGFDHKKLTYRYDGRDFRLTDNYGKIVDGVLNV